MKKEKIVVFGGKRTRYLILEENIKAYIRKINGGN